MEVEDEIRGDPYQNFVTIMETVDFLNKNGLITEEWMTTHRELILKYRAWIPNYAMVNDEVTDPTFRKKCSDMETLLTHLCNNIAMNGRFDVRVYHIFMNHAKYILEHLFAVDILEDAMESLQLSNVSSKKISW